MRFQTRLCFLLLLVVVNATAQQDLTKNFVPLVSSGDLPDVFTQNIRNVIKKDIEELNKSKEGFKTLKTEYLTATNYYIERIVRSGNVLINDEVTTYINQVVDVILKDDPALRSKLKIYTLKSEVVNAYSYDKGFVFIDIGLLAQAETEAQLAYILCHEIAHYTKKHSINRYVEEAKGSYSNKSFEDRLIEKCQYSKELESQADSVGFAMFEKTPYNNAQTEKVFDVLQYSHLPFELVEFKKSFLESKNYVFPKGYFLEEVEKIKNRDSEDDTKSTHPNTASRKAAIAGQIHKSTKKEKQNYVIGKEKFEYIRDLTRMELCRLYLKNRDYANALYAAYILQIKYPENIYVQETIAKCLYAITLYKKGILVYDKSSYFSKGIYLHHYIEGYPQQVYYFIHNTPAFEWNILSLNYIYRKHKKFPDNKILSSYSDSLFVLMNNTTWDITDFTREEVKKDTLNGAGKDTVKKELSKTELISNMQIKDHKTESGVVEDSVYYKRVFLDLFMEDKEFASKFPIRAPIIKPSKKKLINNDQAMQKRRNVIDKEINRIICLEPFYFRIDKRLKNSYQFVESDIRQEQLIEVINTCAKKLEFELVTIDPGVMTKSDVDKINDYSVINDWMVEKFDTEKNMSIIFNTNDIEKITKKYGTNYILKTGIVSQKGKVFGKTTYFVIVVYDIVKNEVAYARFDKFRKRDTKDLLNAKAYQMIYDFKNSKKNAKK